MKGKTIEDLTKHPLYRMLNKIKEDIDPVFKTTNLSTFVEKRNGDNYFGLTLKANWFIIPTSTTLLELQESKDKEKITAYCYYQLAEEPLRKHREEYLRNNSINYFPVISPKEQTSFKGGFT